MKYSSEQRERSGRDILVIHRQILPPPSISPNCGVQDCKK